MRHFLKFVQRFYTFILLSSVKEMSKQPLSSAQFPRKQLKFKAINLLWTSLAYFLGCFFFCIDNYILMSVTTCWDQDIAQNVFFLTARCDECLLSYHFHCLEPPVKKSPKVRGYTWHCEACDPTDHSVRLY